MSHIICTKAVPIQALTRIKQQTFNPTLHESSSPNSHTSPIPWLRRQPQSTCMTMTISSDGKWKTPAFSQLCVPLARAAFCCPHTRYGFISIATVWHATDRFLTSTDKLAWTPHKGPQLSEAQLKCSRGESEGARRVHFSRFINTCGYQC